MKQFACGEIVPGCTAAFESADEDQILRAVAEHARRDHGLTELPPSLIAQVKEKIRDNVST